jgi:hypothetical protein
MGQCECVITPDKFVITLVICHATGYYFLSSGVWSVLLFSLYFLQTSSSQNGSEAVSEHGASLIGEDTTMSMGAYEALRFHIFFGKGLLRSL